jgi:hypothetical protein
MASKYLTSANITDKICLQFITADPTQLDRIDAEIEDLAQRVGLYSVAQIVTPLHYGIIRWAQAWLTMTICLENIGQNNVEVAGDEKYAFKYDMYRKQEATLREKVTKEMFLAIVIRNTDRAPTFNIMVRG